MHGPSIKVPTTKKTLSHARRSKFRAQTFTAPLVHKHQNLDRRGRWSAIAPTTFDKYAIAIGLGDAACPQAVKMTDATLGKAVRAAGEEIEPEENDEYVEYYEEQGATPAVASFSKTRSLIIQHTSVDNAVGALPVQTMMSNKITITNAIHAMIPRLNRPDGLTVTETDIAVPHSGHRSFDPRKS